MVFGPAGELRNFENALCEATAVMTKKEKEREKEDYIRRTQHKQPAIRSASIDTTNAHVRFHFLSWCCSGIEISIQKHTWSLFSLLLLPQNTHAPLTSHNLERQNIFMENEYYKFLNNAVQEYHVLYW